MIQVIVPLYNDPLQCELYFRNYVKYKKQHVDRLIILVSSSYSMLMEPTDPRYVQNTNHLHELLERLEINVHKIVHSQPRIHGGMFNEVLEDIKNPNYHCFFDEQDSYWLNDNFGEFVGMLSELDMIGGGKSQYPHWFDIKKFNATFGVNHNENRSLYALHLPEFLSNRIIAKIDDFDAIARGNVLTNRELGLDTTILSGKEEFVRENIFFDTFQYINLQVFKKTDKIKLYFDYPYDEDPKNINNMAFNIREFLYTNEHDKNIPINQLDYKDNMLYHVGGGSKWVAGPWALSYEQTSETLQKYYVFPESNKPNSNREHKIGFLEFCSDLALNYFYQSLPYLPDFPRKSAYLSNFEKLEQFVDLKRYDCGKIIQQIMM